MCLIIPAYAQDRIARFERAGFEILDERLAMVRHTTVPAVVHTGLAPIPVVEAAERVPRGVPTYLAERRARRLAAHPGRARLVMNRSK
jgi:hypothetical protein